LSYLLDANVLSELTRTRPEPRVLAWFEATPEEALHVSVLTLGEIRQGVERLPPGSRRERLRTWLEHDLPARFEDRVLPVTAAVADRWGRIVAEARRPVPALDSLLAATALQYELRLVTRNVDDFAFPSLELVNPWAADAP
jgi:predicted nucleic acid-binding protein